MKRLLCALALLISSVEAHGAGPRTDYSGIYFNPRESGYGYNFVQTGSFMFVTGYVYADLSDFFVGVPHWFIATLDWNGVDAFVGDAYLTQGGTDFFKPWVPDSVKEMFFGKARFTPNPDSHHAGTLVTDTRGGVTDPGTGQAAVVTHVLVRQPLTSIDLRGSYVGTDLISVSCTNSPPIANPPRAWDLSVSGPTGGPATFTFRTSKAVADCTLVGALDQHGQIHVMPAGTYSCGAVTANATSPEIKRTPQGLEGRYAYKLANGCTYNVGFTATAVLPGQSILP